MKIKLIIIIGIILFVLVICVGYLIFFEDIYETVKNWLTAAVGGFHYARRGIGTNIDLWLNGYLGIFFRFKNVGFFNWLAIPLFVYFLFTIRKRKRWEIAIGLTLSALIIFISLQGYTNSRYPFTLFPAILTTIFLFGWPIYQKRWSKFRNVAVLIFCVIIMATFFMNHDYYWSRFLKPIISGKNSGFPLKVITYINRHVDLGEDGVILEVNQPLLYYYTDKKGISYRSQKLKKIYRSSKNKEQSFWKLKNNVKAKYILIRSITQNSFHNTKYEILNYFTDFDCSMLVSEKNYKLYKLNESPYNLSQALFYYNQGEIQKSITVYRNAVAPSSKNTKELSDQETISFIEEVHTSLTNDEKAPAEEIQVENIIKDVLLEIDFSTARKIKNQTYIVGRSGQNNYFIDRTTRLIAPNSAINLSQGTLSIRARLTSSKNKFSYLVGINQNKDLRIRHEGKSGKFRIYYSGVRLGDSSLAITDDKWHHYVFTWQDGEQKFFIDGMRCLTGNVAASTSATENFAIGWSGNKDGKKWVDHISDLKTFKRPLFRDEFIAISDAKIYR